MMRAVDLIRKKRDGRALSKAEIDYLIKGYTAGDVPDYQMAALAMAIFFVGLDDDELTHWTSAMLHSGELLDLSDIEGPKVDKHSTGGVGDKTSFVLGPVAAACGCKVPMISGRGLGHTGGTLDKLESIPNFDVAISTARLRQLVRDNGIAIVGQTTDICPADRLLYSLRDVTATVRCMPLIASSIMSKKLAEGLEGLVLDVKVGSGAFMATLDDARELAELMVGIGAGMGVETRALLTNMDQPLGRCVGNALELAEAIDVLRDGGPADLRELSLELASEMVLLGGLAPDLSAARANCEASLADGSALTVFRRVIESQGGDPAYVDDADMLPKASFVEALACDVDGHVSAFDCAAVGIAAMHLGAGRALFTDAIDHAVGFEIQVKLGDAVTVGQPLAVIHANDEALLAAAKNELREAITISDGAPVEAPLIWERVGRSS